jgi:hypothetical protein
MSYQTDFDAALAFTAELGLPVPQAPRPGVRPVLSDSYVQQLLPRLFEAARVRYVEDLFAKCNIVSEHFAPLVESELKMRAYLTVGDVRMHG